MRLAAVGLALEAEGGFEFIDHFAAILADTRGKKLSRPGTDSGTLMIEQTLAARSIDFRRQDRFLLRGDKGRIRPFVATQEGIESLGTQAGRITFPTCQD